MTAPFELKRRKVDEFLSKSLRQYSVVGFFILLVVGIGLITPAFFKPANLTNILIQFSPLGIVVLGQAFVIIARGIDLSVASVMATSAVAVTVFPPSNEYVPFVVCLALSIGAVTGLANGLLVTKRHVSPFLATLGTTIVLEGLRLFWTQGAASGTIPSAYRVVGSMTIAGIPYSLLGLVFLSVVLTLILHNTVYGRRLFIVGGNPSTARLVGIRADVVTIGAYVICGCTAALGGLVLAGNVGMIDNYTGRGYELDSITAAVLGGVALTGGRGRLHNALLGAAILVCISNAVLLFGIPIQFQMVIKGAIVVVAAAFYVGNRA